MELDGWLTPTNPATVKAQKILKKQIEDRHAQNGILPKKTWKKWQYCQKCKSKNNFTKYHITKMHFVKYTSVQNGSEASFYTKYCNECFKTYVPKGKRLKT